jgi:hypothetical protein
VPVRRVAPWRLLLALLGLWAGAARAEGEPAPLWFAVGEELRYEVYWGVVHVADSRVTTEWIEQDGRRLLAIRFRTQSNGFLKKIYPVNDFIESIVDPATFLPLRFTKTLNEGRYRTDEVTHFDHGSGVATWENRKNGKKKEFPIEADTRDIVTFMYYLRAQAFTPGQQAKFRVMADEKLYDLFFRVGPADEMKFEKFGKVRSVRIEPEAAFEGIFVRKGKLTIWVSEDPRRVCTRLMATTPFANVRVNLAEVLGPGDDFWVSRSAPSAQAAAPPGAQAAAGSPQERTAHVD